MNGGGEDVWFGAPRARARQVVILVHGRDQDPQFMDEHVVRRLGAPGDVAFVAPAAPGRTWYPASFLAPAAVNEPALAASLLRLAALVEKLAMLGWAARDHVIVGFSQGACLACAHLLATPTPPAAVFAFTGALPGELDAAWPAPRARLHGVRVVVSGSARDAWVPASRMRDTAAAFAEHGAAVEFALRDDDRHEISDAELARVSAVLAPDRRASGG